MQKYAGKHQGKTQNESDINNAKKMLFFNSATNAGHGSIIPALGTLKEEDHCMLEARLSYLVSSKPAGTTQRQIFKKKNKWLKKSPKKLSKFTI